MINILKEKQRMMKEPSSIERDATIIVLNEVRTLETLERNNIDAKMQYKWFEKLLNNRNTAANIYKSQNRMDLYEKENAEINVIKHYLNELEKELPKQLSEEEVKNILIQFKNEQPFCKIGDVMRFFTNKYPEQNKAMISNVFKTLNN